MKKVLLATGIVAAMAVPAFANPFSDVSADHWAYDAIDKLAENGVVAGYPDGAYKGNRTMTRYEMAEFTARAMAYEEAEDARISAENKAMIDKLAAEFGAELDALGVRVAALEDKVGNVKFTGVARLRVVNEKHDGVKVKGDSDKKNSYNMRIRLNADAQVNDKVSVHARFTTDNRNLESRDGGNSKDARFDQYSIRYNGKHVKFIVGREDAFLGQGTIIDDNLLGAQLIVPFGKDDQYHFAAIHGRLDADDLGQLRPLDNMNLTAFELAGKFGASKKFGAGLDYGIIRQANKVNFNGLPVANDHDVKVFGVNLSYDFNDKYGVFAEYVKTDLDANLGRNANGVPVKAKDNAFVIGVKGQPTEKLGFDVVYGSIGGAAVVSGISTWTDGLDNDIFNGGVSKATMWKVGLNYKLMKNTTLYANYWNVNNKDSAVAVNQANLNKSKAKYQRFEMGMLFKF